MLDQLIIIIQNCHICITINRTTFVYLFYLKITWDNICDPNCEVPVLSRWL